MCQFRYDEPFIADTNLLSTEVMNGSNRPQIHTDNRFYLTELAY
jgi:hypothetical protein